MRRMTACLLVLWMLFCACGAMAEEAPGSIRDAIGNGVIVSAAKWEESGGKTWFVLAQAQETGSVLYCYGEENGRWVEKFRTSDAIAQGKRVELHFSEGAWNFTEGEKYFPGPILLVLQHAQDDTTVERLMAFQRTDGEAWKLIALNNYPAGMNIQINDESITYYTTADKARMVMVGSACRNVERDLRFFCIEEFPMTFQQAQDNKP